MAEFPQQNLLDKLISWISARLNPPSEKYDWTTENGVQKYKPVSQITPSPTRVPTVTPTPQPTKIPTPQILGEYARETGRLARNPRINDYTIPEEVKKAIFAATQKYPVPSDLMFDIALQESSFNPSLENRTPEGMAVGVPKGLYQFTPSTMKTVQNYANMPGSSLDIPENPDLFDPYINALIAAYLISNGQLGRWNASQDVWGPNYGFNEVEPYYKQTEPERIPRKNWR